MKVLYISVLLLTLVGQIRSAKILAVYAMPSTSHYILGSGLVRTLVDAGHDVTLISAYKAKDMPKTNGTWTDIVIPSLLNAEDDMAFNPFELENVNPYFVLPVLNMIGKLIVTTVMEAEEVQNLMKSDAKFDIVIVEQFFNHAFYGLAHHFKANLIIISSTSATSWINNLIANPAPPSYIPELILSYSRDMSFFQRVNNVVFQLYADVSNWLYIHRIQAGLLQKYFPNAPPLEDLMYNVSLIFVNSNFATAQAIPKVPNMIDVGGYHLQAPKALPKDIKDYLDNAKEGVIYFSMGSVLKSAEMPLEKRNAILKVFAKLKQKVLWKFEDDQLTDLPPNVKIGKWLPQNDILPHPNVKLFITHGGFTSTTETLYHGTPVLAIPIFGDQKANAAQAVKLGYGQSLTFRDLNEETLWKSIQEVLNNPIYTQNAKYRSQIFKDEITTPKERIAFWTDYVVRHKGAPHLMVDGVKLPWYKYLVLDVYAFLIACLGLFIFSVRCAIKMVCCKNKKTVAPKKSQKVKKN